MIRIRLPKRLPDAAIEVQCGKGPFERVPCQVWETGVPGLVVTHAVVPGGRSGYLVTHAGSMRGVCAVEQTRLGHAIMFARHLRGLLDWTASVEALSAEHRAKGMGNRLPYEAMLCAIRLANVRRPCRTAEALRWRLWRKRALAAIMADHEAGRREPSATARAAMRWGYPGREGVSDGAHE